MFDEGDYLMIPTPYYTGFDHDFTKRFKVNFLYAHLEAKNSFQHDINAFRDAYNQCEDKDRVKAILLTNPHNPTGEILSAEFKKDIINIENDRTIVRDKNSKALLSVNYEGLKAYKIERNRNNKILEYENDINTLKQEVTEIRSAIELLVNKLT